MNIIPADTYEYSQRLWKVLKTNYNLELANRIIHEMFDNDNYAVLEDENIDITREFQMYRENRAGTSYRITQLSLPYRFGMYKPQIKNVNVKDKTELKIPESESPVPEDPNHRTRKIFG